MEFVKDIDLIRDHHRSNAHQIDAIHTIEKIGLLTTHLVQRLIHDEETASIVETLRERMVLLNSHIEQLTDTLESLIAAADGR